MNFEERRHRSVSQLNSFTRCGEAYRLERIEHKPSPPAAWTVRGTAVHEALRRWEDDRSANVHGLFLEEWDKALENQKARYPDLKSWQRTPRVLSTERDLDLRAKDGLMQMMEYTRRAVREEELWWPLRMPSGALAVELPFNLDLGPEVPFTIRGYIDLIKEWADGSVTVTDLKTGGDDSENYRQIGLYGYAARTVYGIDIHWGEYWYSKLDRSSGWKNLDHYNRDYLVEEYTKLDTAIELNLFLANPSKKNCAFCGVRDHCQEMKNR